MRIFTSDRKLTPSWSLVEPSIALVKKYIWHVLYLSFLPGLLMLVALVLFGDVASGTESFTTVEPRHAFGAGLFIVAIIWSLIAMPAFIYLQLKAVNGEVPSIVECYQKGIGYLLPLIGMYLVAAFLTLIALLAFIIPGLLLIRGFLLAPYYVVDKKMGPLEALKQSYRDSRSVTVYIWGVIGVTGVFAILGSILGIIPVIGSFLSLATGYIYIFSEPLRYVEVIKGKLAKLPN